MRAGDLLARAEAKRKLGLHWEASRLETIAGRIEASPYDLPATITVLTDLHEQALVDVERERPHLGSSYDEAVARMVAAENALAELGALN